MVAEFIRTRTFLTQLTRTQIQEWCWAKNLPDGQTWPETRAVSSKHVSRLKSTGAIESSRWGRNRFEFSLRPSNRHRRTSKSSRQYFINIKLREINAGRFRFCSILSKGWANHWIVGAVTFWYCLCCEWSTLWAQVQNVECTEKADSLAFLWFVDL